MRYLVDALLAGEVVEAGDVINVTARKFEAVSRPVPQRPPPKSVFRCREACVGQGGAPMALILLVGVAVLDFRALRRL